MVVVVKPGIVSLVIGCTNAISTYLLFDAARLRILPVRVALAFFSSVIFTPVVTVLDITFIDAELEL